MSLTKQLLAVGLLSLLIPWAGFRYVQEIELALRTSLERSLLSSAATVALALQDHEALESRRALARGPESSAVVPVYGHTLASDPQIDGSRDDWNLAAAAAAPLGRASQYWVGVHDRFAYVFIEVADPSVVYQRTPRSGPYGDRLVMLLQPGPGEPHWLVFPTSAPGALRARETRPPLFAPGETFDDRVLGSWRETPGGFDIEVRVPIALVGSALGLGIVNVDLDGDAYRVSMAATWDTADSLPGPFVYQVPSLQADILPFSRGDDRIRVIDAEGWALADTGRLRLDAVFGSPSERTLTEDVLRYALQREYPSYEDLEKPAGRIADPALLRVLQRDQVTAWYRGAADRSAIVVAAVPIARGGDIVGAVLLEQATDAILTATNQALLRLMSFSLAAAIAATIGLLGFATFLSFRVKRLAAAAETAMGPKGEIDTKLPGDSARDELGALARSFADLLERLREHTEYLRTLTSKLSHELRTPLAIVSTSVDNLEHEIEEPRAAPYLNRLRDGANRLDAILAAMSEATRIEQAIIETPAEMFDLQGVVVSCCNAYGDVYPERSFVCKSSVASAPVVGSSELIAQLMDKLIDNAVSFSPAGSRIEVGLELQRAEFCLAITNYGSRLPEKMRQQLFDSLVSVRDVRTPEPHLGLGLYIASLIAQFHHGRIVADNLPDLDGVVFRVFVPKAR